MHHRTRFLTRRRARRGVGRAGLDTASGSRSPTLGVTQKHKGGEPPPEPSVTADTPARDRGNASSLNIKGGSTRFPSHVAATALPIRSAGRVLYFLLGVRRGTLGFFILGQGGSGGLPTR